MQFFVGMVKGLSYRENEEKHSVAYFKRAKALAEQKQQDWKQAVSTSSAGAVDALRRQVSEDLTRAGFNALDFNIRIAVTRTDENGLFWGNNSVYGQDYDLCMDHATDVKDVAVAGC